MTCKEFHENILTFEQLSEQDQNQLLEHIEQCSDCQLYFNRYLTLEEGLDIILEKEQVHVAGIKKKSYQRIFKTALLTCASLLLLIVGAWNTPPVKAVIKKALNEVIIDHFLNGQKPLNHQEDSATTENIIYMEQNLQNGETVYVYVSGQKVRKEYQNGNYSISDEMYLASYSKKDNLFVLKELDYEGIPYEVEFFRNIDPKNISYLGEKMYLNRKANVYLVKEGQHVKREYWFDKDSSLFIKEVEIYNGKRQEWGGLKKFEMMKVKKNHRLFDFIAPEGARIVDESK
ncbi:hypothetical protein WQ54_10360 [Bacillus sp. SA1-12]|uniref:hypothetical protein n=1 Tax=Bacillus sp. SA1-12 TaxID=1455638 RepID=UPI0006262AAF|nr:hypothetical protein [Bacillus sp. SA1-12]KKI92218.1 hypothetical protein WQ54_10360 [Bacillus sp. SA1-12]